MTIKSLEIDQYGGLIVTWSDGTVENLGHVTGADGRPGANGQNGVNGTNGIDGTDGINGTNGTNGVDGVSVTGATINDEGKLVLTLSNGQEIVVGNVVGPAGQNAEGGRGCNGNITLSAALAGVAMILFAAGVVIAKKRKANK